jgi:hypothetical protein
MNNRRTLLISLLVLGLLLIGGGIWWKLDASSNNLKIYPIISMEVTDENVGSHDFLYICEDMNVYLIQEIEARANLGREWSKEYRQSQMVSGAFDDLIRLFRDNLDKLQENYQYAGQSGPAGSNSQAGLDTIVTIKYRDMAKKIVALDYLTGYSSFLPASSEYAGMPAPLDKICKRLSEIGSATKEFYKETTPAK